MSLMESSPPATPFSRVTVRVPGSTSNCGAGFDSLGLALAVHNRVKVERGAEADTAVRPADASDGAAHDMVEMAAGRFFAVAGVAPFGFSYGISGEVPPARGLGSSVTVLAGVLGGLNVLAGEPLDRTGLVALVTALEGHPDNAAAGILGGFCVARCDPATNVYHDTVRIVVPAELRFVVVSPAIEIKTKASRGVLPAHLPFFDAVKSVNSAVYLTAALATGDYAKLRGAVFDCLHEPYRLPGIPGGRAAIDAGVAAGGLAGWLSGSGSSVLVVSEAAAAATVGGAMQAAFDAAGLRSEVRLLEADNNGLVVESRH